MRINFTRNIGFILLAIYLIIIGISALVPTFVLPVVVLGILALVAGVCILLGI